MMGSLDTILTDGLHAGGGDVVLSGNVNDEDISFLHHWESLTPDSSLVGHTVVGNNGCAVSGVQAKFGTNSLRTVGASNHYWEVGSHRSWDCITTQGFSLDLWLYPESSAVTGVVIGLGINNTWYMKLLYNTDNTLTWQASDGTGSFNQTTVGTVPEDQWTHVALEYAPELATTNSLWIGGTRELNFNGGQILWSILNGATFLTGGGDQKFSGSNGANYDGFIDETRFIIRSPSDQRTTYSDNATITVPSAPYQDPA